MAFRLRFPALALAVLAAVAAPVRASDTPPTSLHLVGDHWTAWDPPTSLPPDTKIHIVVKGDTLWALAQTYLGNPYLWPQIWEKNQYVLDAHWIYPGDPLAVGVQVTPASEAVAEQTGEPRVGEAAPAGDESGARMPRPSSLEARLNTPEPLGSERDIHCTGFIAEVDEELPFGISGTEYDELVPRIAAAKDWNVGSGLFGRMETMKYQLTFGDIVYVDAGRAAGLAPGVVLVAVEPASTIRDPDNRNVLGRFHRYLGRVRVLTALEDRSIAEIIQSCEGIHTGARMKLYEPEPVPLARRRLPRPVNDPTMNDLSNAPRIVHADEGMFTLGQDSVVFLDRGESDDIYPGDQFTIYRTARNEGGLPIAVGQLGVLSVRPHSATAKILTSRYPVYVGDRLER